MPASVPLRLSAAGTAAARNSPAGAPAGAFAAAQPELNSEWPAVREWN